MTDAIEMPGALMSGQVCISAAQTRGDMSGPKKVNKEVHTSNGTA